MQDNRRNDIVLSALKLFAAKGYASTPVSAIARSAGVSQGLMYNWFPSKEALLIEILNIGMQQIAGSMSGFQTEKDPRKALLAHMRSTFRLAEQEQDFWRLFHSIRLQDNVREVMGEAMEKGVEEILHILTKHFRALGYPQARKEAKLYFAMIDGLVNHYLQDPHTFHLQPMVQLLKEKYQL